MRMVKLQQLTPTHPLRARHVVTRAAFSGCGLESGEAASERAGEK